MGKNLRRSASFSLVAVAVLMHGHASAAPQAFQSAAGNEKELVIVTTGDTIIMRRLQAINRPGIDRMWGLIRGADAAFTNFETQITDYTFPAAQQSGGTYLSSPAWVLDEFHGPLERVTPGDPDALSAVNIPLPGPIFAYNVGFGDSFLLRFTYADASRRHVLIDLGSTDRAENAPSSDPT